MTLITSTHKSTYKKWLCLSVVAAALSLGACADKGAATTEDDPTEDAQTSVEQEASGVASANDPSMNDDVAVASDTDSAMAGDDVAVASADGTVVEGVDDAEMLDGSETEEHVSTY